MCKKNHDWVTVYQDGGFYVMCTRCGLSTPWRRNSERGRGCVAFLALACACIFPAFVAWIIAKELWGQAVADITAVLVYGIGMVVSICCVVGPIAPDLEDLEDVE